LPSSTTKRTHRTKPSFRGCNWHNFGYAPIAAITHTVAELILA
jgi:hypothetical protein